MKKRLTFLLALVLLLTGCAPPGKTAENKGVTFLDSGGNTLLTAYNTSDIYNHQYWAYLDVAAQEAAELMAIQTGSDPEKALQALFAPGYQIQTNLDTQTYEALKALEEKTTQNVPVACAITDLEGNLLAVYSSLAEDSFTNYAAQGHAPYSSFKALSVYAPALEKGILNWSSMVEDSPYKQIRDDFGKLQDWPANASGTYSREQVSVYDALRKSLNTVAVKWLNELGVKESIEFLQNNFEISLDAEAYSALNYGEEEVIGSVALGYLEKGVTPAQLAGCYQIFATGGEYIAPKAVEKITGADGSTLYSRQKAAKQVISPATADTMNKLLQGVLKSGGTGVSAAVKDLAVAGKTGTGDEFADNWFVGVTPGYSCAVWHGQDSSNRAAGLFAAVIEELYRQQPNALPLFITHKNLQQVAYCAKSGLMATDGCAMIQVGYFADKNALPECGACANQH